MTRSLVVLTAALLLAPSAALAGTCDAITAKASSAKGDDLVKAYRDLTACDKKVAEAQFETFMKSSGDADTLSGLSLAAIDAEIYTPVWAMMDKISSFDQRSAVASGVGGQCKDHPKVVNFVQGAYFGLRDIQFQKWEDAIEACSDDGLSKWIEGVVQKPPASSYDEKYNTITTAYAKRKRVAALPVLQQAAIDAAKNNGPFAMLIEKMDAAVEPEMGETMSDADKKSLQDALVAVANAVGPEQAAQVADRLYNAGAADAAASLLPRVYPDRVQGGKLMYGAAAVEVCDKEAIVHYAEVTDPAKRWSILGDVETPARAFKPKLKCTPKDPWPVVATTEPVASPDKIQPWVDDIVKQYAAKGLDVKTKEEKAIELK